MWRGAVVVTFVCMHVTLNTSFCAFDSLNSLKTIMCDAGRGRSSVVCLLVTAAHPSSPAHFFLPSIMRDICILYVYICIPHTSGLSPGWLSILTFMNCGPIIRQMACTSDFQLGSTKSGADISCQMKSLMIQVVLRIRY